MDYRVGRVGADDIAQPVGVCDVAVLEGTPAHGVTMAVAQIVEHNRRVAGRVQRLAGVAPDITRTTGDEDRCHSGQPGLARRFS